MAYGANHRSLKNSHWMDAKVLLPALFVAALIGGYYVYSTNAATAIWPLLVDRNGRDNHAGVKAFACKDTSITGDKIRVRVSVIRPNSPKYNTEALSSSAAYGKTATNYVSGWTDNSQTYFINADKEDLIAVNVRFSNDYKESYKYMRHYDGRLAPVRASQLDGC